jgi:hypothetical protein
MIRVTNGDSVSQISVSKLEFMIATGDGTRVKNRSAKEQFEKTGK